MDVYFFEAFEEEEEFIRKHLPASIQASFTSKTVQATATHHAPAQVISIRTQSEIPDRWCQQISGILTRSTGYDHLMRYREKYASKVALGYLPAYSARSVAEQAILMMLSLFRKLKKQLHQFDTFNRDGLTGNECLNHTVLVVGVGNIGKEIVKLAQGLGMKVLGVDLVKRMELLEYVDLKEGISRTDVVFCALPLTDLTKGMLGYKALHNGKQGSYLINVGRGEVTPIEDLKRLLEENLLGGIALDVFEDEGDLGDCLRKEGGKLRPSGEIILSLKDDDRVIFTPHNAFNTREATEKKARQSIESLACFSEKGSFPHLVPS